jgi:hypothetical protein
MKRTKFSEILDTLKTLDHWLARLGIKCTTDRIHHAIGVVEKANEGWKKLRETKQPAKIGNADDYYFGLVEALEFSDIFQAFENEDPKVVGPKLERALSGPPRPADETTKNSDGRNTMFELALAAQMKLNGAQVSIGDPDVKVILSGKPFFVECKRPFRQDSLRANVRGAAGQLGTHLETDPDAGGIVAVSVTRLLNSGDKLFVAASEPGKERLGDRIEQMVTDTERGWNKYEFHPRISALFFHVRTPGVIEDQDLFSMVTYAVAKPIAKQHGFEILETKLPELLSEKRGK